MSFAKRLWHNGEPIHAEHAYAALGEAQASKDVLSAEKWFRTAEVHAMLAVYEAQQDLARSNRELAAAMNRLADLREGARD